MAGVGNEYLSGDDNVPERQDTKKTCQRKTEYKPPDFEVILNGKKRHSKIYSKKKKNKMRKKNFQARLFESAQYSFCLSDGQSVIHIVYFVCSECLRVAVSDND